MGYLVPDELAFSLGALRAGNAALGFWVRAGAWSAAQRLDGHLPAELVPALAGTPDQVAALEAAGLMTPVLGGWQLPWLGPTAAEQDRRRTNAATRQARRRARSTGQDDATPPNGDPDGAWDWPDEPQDDGPPDDDDRDVTRDVTRDITDPVTPPAPAEPTPNPGPDTTGALAGMVVHSPGFGEGCTTPPQTQDQSPASVDNQAGSRDVTRDVTDTDPVTFWSPTQTKPKAAAAAAARAPAPARPQPRPPALAPDPTGAPAHARTGPTRHPALHRTRRPGAQPGPEPDPAETVAVEILAARAALAGMVVRWDTLTAPEISEVAALVATHGDQALIAAAAACRAAHTTPAASARAWLPTWRAMPEPGRRHLALVDEPRCPDHPTENARSCRSCAADRKAAGSNP